MHNKQHIFYRIWMVVDDGMKTLRDVVTTDVTEIRATNVVKSI